MSRRVGPRMEAVVGYVRRHQGCVMVDAARHVGPHGSLNYGYRTVHRAARAGLIVLTPGPRTGTYRIFLSTETLCREPL